MHGDIEPVAHEIAQFSGGHDRSSRLLKAPGESLDSY
jgi:hypothetical protein